MIAGFKRSVLLGLTLSMLVPQQTRCDGSAAGWIVGGAMAIAACAVIYKVVAGSDQTDDEVLSGVCRVDDDTNKCYIELRGKNLTSEKDLEAIDPGLVHRLLDYAQQTKSAHIRLDDLMMRSSRRSKSGKDNEAAAQQCDAMSKRLSSLSDKHAFFSANAPYVQAYTNLRSVDRDITRAYGDLLEWYTTHLAGKGWFSRGGLSDEVRCQLNILVTGSHGCPEPYVVFDMLLTKNIEHIKRELRSNELGKNWNVYNALMAKQYQLEEAQKLVRNTKEFKEQQKERAERLLKERQVAATEQEAQAKATVADAKLREADAKVVAAQAQQDMVYVERDKVAALQAQTHVQARSNEVIAEQNRVQRQKNVLLTDQIRLQREKEEREKKAQEARERETEAMRNRPPAFNPAAMQHGAGSIFGGPAPSAPPADDPPPYDQPA